MYKGPLALFGRIIVSSSLLFEVEGDDNKEIISGPIIDLYDVAFIKCNAKSHAFSAVAANELYSAKTFFEHSGGIASHLTATTVRVQSLASFDMKSDSSIEFPKANMEISQCNFTNGICSYVYHLGTGPVYLDSRFISLIENICYVCANLESDNNCINKNTCFQFIRNKCSGYLFTSWRANCNCDWFFFIENNITKCKHAEYNVITFTNSFSTSEMIVETGSINGTVSITMMHTELPFPPVFRKPQTLRVKKMKLTLLVASLNFIFM